MKLKTRFGIACGALALLFSGAWGGVAAGAGLAHGSHAAGSGLHLKRAGYLTVGSDTTYPPMEFQSPSTKQYMGADVDLANALARAMGLKGAVIVSHIFDTIIPSLQRGDFDVIMSSMNDTPARRQQVSFVDYMRAGEGIVVRKGSSIKANGYGQVCGHSVAVESGTTEFSGLQAANATCKKKINIKVYPLDTAAFQAFAAGHAEAYSGDSVVCGYYVKQHPSTFRLAGAPFAASEDYGIAVRKNNHALRTALQSALAKIRANGQYKRILNKWGVNIASL
ncbi:MAG TPA: ABC transporter substrate-binding protein [Chloroflexota bacterium]|nr:ABC transporter substrate-binding protein [Chloroflexota bacterium]